MGWLFAKGIQWYGWYELVAQDSQDGLLFDSQDGYHQYSSHELFDAVAETFLFEFSHYSNQIAFVPLPNSNELWLSDVTYQRPKKLLSVDPSGDGSNPLWGLRIVWSPDDRYLFLYHEAQLELNLIYNLSTEKLEPWYWQCDSIILSPQSGRLAPLCPRIPGIATEQAAYAIVEWGGEIWFTDEELGEPFLQPTPEELAFWEWSLNGEWLAYFEPNDPAGYLFIADAFGNVRQFFPGISVFNEPEGQKIRYFPSANNVFAWARNAPILLVEGYGQPEQPCPPYFTPFHDDDVPIWPCWQAINIDTGEIVWSQASLVENLILAGEEDTTGVAIRDIAIAPNGRALAFHILDPYRNIIVDLQTARVTNLSFVYIPIEQLYWADEP